MNKLNSDKANIVFKRTMLSDNIINNIFININDIIKKLGEIYDDLVNKYNKKQFIIMLDTFHFQKNLLKIEYDNLIYLRNIIFNRIYCDYYKLITFIKKYINDNINDTKIQLNMNKFSNYEKYDNLNINKKYDVNKIQILFSDIISILDLIDNYINFLNADISNNSSKSNLGLNIDKSIQS